MNQFSEEDRRLAEECVNKLSDGVLYDENIYHKKKESTEVILETVIQKKNERIQRLEELLARAIVLNQIYNDMSPTLEHCLDDIKRADFSPEIEQARELVRGIQ